MVSCPYLFSDACMTPAATSTDSMRRRSAKARNRGRWGTERCSSGYGDLVSATVAAVEGKISCEGRSGVGASVEWGWGAGMKGEKAAAALREGGDRVGGAGARE